MFTADAIVSGGGIELRGREQIPSPLDYLGRHYPKSMHLMGNHDVTLDGDLATGVVYCVAHHLSLHDDGARGTVMMVRYVDRYLCTAVGWRIEQRTINVDWE